MVLVDHISLISPESCGDRTYNLHMKSISILSSDYLLKLRNRFNYIPVVQQQAQAQKALRIKKMNKLKPSMDGLGDNNLNEMLM
jgi:hypothetical protein